MNRKWLHRIGAVTLLWALAWTAASCKMAGDASTRGGWRPIFNGKTTEGWQMIGAGELKLEKGELVTYGGRGLLWYTREKFGDCRIRVMFQPTMPDDNSGVFIRIPEPPRDPRDAVNHGYEVQIENNGDAWHRTGCLYSISEARHKVNARVNEWNEMMITLEGKRTRVEVNGELVTDYTEGDSVPPKVEDDEPDRGPRPTFGYIGLQNHGEDAHVRFRGLSVAPLR